jgi:hypothetical protein
MQTTTFTAIIANNGWILRLVDGPHMGLEKVKQHWPEAKWNLPFRRNECGDICVQYAIEGEEAMKYGFKQHQQFQFQA